MLLQAMEVMAKGSANYPVFEHLFGEFVRKLHTKYGQINNRELVDVFNQMLIFFEEFLSFPEASRYLAMSLISRDTTRRLAYRVIEPLYEATTTDTITEIRDTNHDLASVEVNADIDLQFTVTDAPTSTRNATDSLKQSTFSGKISPVTPSTNIVSVTTETTSNATGSFQQSTFFEKISPVTPSANIVSVTTETTSNATGSLKQSTFSEKISPVTPSAKIVRVVVRFIWRKFCVYNFISEGRITEIE